MNEIELKPCPFCGAKAEAGASIEMTLGNKYIRFYVECREGCTSRHKNLKVAFSCSFSDIEAAMNEVIDMWNRRYPDESDTL